MLRLILRISFVFFLARLVSSCGVDAVSRNDRGILSAPKYLIARADVRSQDGGSTPVEFASVSSSKEISSGKDAAHAFNSGEKLVADRDGKMRAASSPEMEFGLGSPSQMPTQMDTSCAGKGCGPSQMSYQSNCECVTSSQNTGLFPRLRSFFQKLNPFAQVGKEKVPYNYGTQYSEGQYQYTVYKQPQTTPTVPGGSQPGTQYPSPYGSQPSNPQPTMGQEPMPGSLTGN